MEPKFESGREWSGSGAEDRGSEGRSRASHSQGGVRDQQRVSRGNGENMDRSGIIPPSFCHLFVYARRPYTHNTTMQAGLHEATTNPSIMSFVMFVLVVVSE